MSSRPLTLTRNDSGRLVVTQVRRDTPAAEAGLNVDDEILAIGDYRVRADRLDNRLEQYRPGDRVTLLVARREQLLRLNLTFGAEPPRSWRLEVHPAAQDGQQSARQKWLSAGKA
jgi:predicted metalloprotease with PDZ domain